MISWHFSFIFWAIISFLKHRELHENKNKFFVHPIFSSFGFSNFGHFSCLIFRLAHLALQNINKDYVIFSYFCNFVAKSNEKPKTKRGMNETKDVTSQSILPQCDMLVSKTFSLPLSVDLRRYPKRLRTLWWSAIHLDKPTCHGDCPTMAKAHFWPST